MFLLWHPSLTAINLSYTFPILETSATALCGTTGIFQYKMLVLSAKCNLCCAAGCGLTGSCSERSRNGLGSAAHWKSRFSCFHQISVRCWVVILRGRRIIWWVWRVAFVAPRIVNDVSYVTRIKHASHSVWQAHYLVKVKCHFSWQAQYLVKVKCHFSWQAQYLVKVKCHFSWQAQYLVKVKCHFSWQAQYLVKLKCHFSLQAQYLVKFGKIAGARNVLFFNTKCSSWARNVTSVARRAADWQVHARNGLGTVSDRPRIGNDVSAVFTKFLSDVGWSFCVAGALFDEFGGWHLLLRAL